MSGKSKTAGPTAHIDYRDGRPIALHLSKVKLVVEDALGEVREYIFDQDVVTIGSSDENDLVINDSRVSRAHCRIVREHSGYMVADLGSTNGTMVNRVRVREAWLKSGTTLKLGGVEVRFQTFGERVEVMPSTRDSFGNVVGRSRRMREVFAILERIAPTAATVILEGETGSGKEVVARALHARSPRAGDPFVVFDCSAVPKELLESELFGHEKGSFTGAHQARQGLFEIANGGTLFLDEIGEMSLELQPKLLRALEQREIRRVGGNRQVKIDVRLVAATNRVLEEEVRAGRFRDDLYYRLSVVRISLPPLRERKEDIPLLARHFLRHAPFNRDPDGEPRIKGISEEALLVLMEYEWPGNVRELINVVERATSFADGDMIDIDDLSPHVLGNRRRSGVSAGDGTGSHTATIRHRKTFKEAKEEWVARFERDYLAALLKRHDYGISAAARDADIDRKYLRKLARKHGLLPVPGGKNGR
ncbi:MAG: FHA domain-containing protein [Deltaproteobacteria bacterium]|nr:FHA domain-containing protein [Deltaproteobacteria bacterium]